MAIRRLRFFLVCLTWKGKRYFGFVVKRDSLFSFCTFSISQKSKKVKNPKFRLPRSSHPPPTVFILFLFLCVRDFKHQRKEKDRTKRRARILLQHTNTENVSHRFISCLRAHTLRETQHRRKRKRKRKKNKKRTPLILVEGVETSSFRRLLESFESSKR